MDILNFLINLGLLLIGLVFGLGFSLLWKKLFEKIELMAFLSQKEIRAIQDQIDLIPDLEERIETLEGYFEVTPTAEENES